MRKKETQNIGQVLKEMLDELNLRRKVDETYAITVFRQLLGEPLGRYIRDVTIRQGRMVVQVSSAAVRNELVLRRGLIRERINQTVGQELVKDLVIR